MFGMDSYRSRVRRSFSRSLERQAYRATRKMVRKALRSKQERLEVLIAGDMRANAWMTIGWKPEVESITRGYKIYKLYLDTPPMGW